jgi:hypothetical protein
MMDNAVKLIKMDDETATVGGYGVVFGGRDLEGETFTADTDFKMDLVMMTSKPTIKACGLKHSLIDRLSMSTK